MFVFALTQVSSLSLAYQFVNVIGQGFCLRVMEQIQYYGYVSLIGNYTR